MDLAFDPGESEREWSPLTAAVGARTGIVESLSTRRRQRDGPPLFVTASQMADLSPIIDKELSSVTFATGGKGVTRGQSRASAIGEALERYCAYCASQRPTLTGTRADLRDEGHAVVDFEYLDVFEPSQYERLRELTPWSDPPTDDTSIEWTVGTNLVTGEPTYAPASLVTMGVDPETTVTFLGTSNGLACGPTLQAALRASIDEVVERDAIMRTWFEQRSPTRLDVDDDAIARQRAAFSNDAVDYVLLDCPTDLDYHAICCVAVDDRETDRRFVMAGGASVAPRAALRDALLEAGQSRSSIAGLEHRYTDAEIDIERETGFEANVAYYARPENFEHVSFLLEGPTERRQLPAAPADPYAATIDALADADLTPIGFDLTTEDVAGLGPRVTRVLIPELVPLTPPAFPPADHPRLRDSIATREPHPFP